MFQETRCGIEATLDHFIKTDCWKELDRAHQAALQIYRKLKEIGCEKGHTFEYWTNLVTCASGLRSYRSAEQSKGLDILETYEVVHRDKEEPVKGPPKGPRIHLMKFWKAENKIADNLARLVSKHREDLTEKVDFERYY